MFISGYLLGRKPLSSKEEIKSFYIGRLKRFYVLYALSAIILFLLGFIEDIPLLITT